MSRKGLEPDKNVGILQTGMKKIRKIGNWKFCVMGRRHLVDPGVTRGYP